jgi:hypothetical protein
VSLTSHLNDPASLVRRFLREQFPSTRAVAGDYRAMIERATLIRPAQSAGYLYGLIGAAFDYRVRFYFPCEQRHYIATQGAWMLCREQSTLCPVLVAEFWHSLEAWLKIHRPESRELDRDSEEMLARYCVVLALWEQTFRCGAVSPLFFPAPKNVEHLLNLARGEWIEDISLLSRRFWRSHEALTREHAVLNPTFAGSLDVGGADADLIIGGCLLDIKTTVKIGFRSDWLYQLLGYVLLDYDNEYCIHEVALYFARQGVLLRWPLDKFLPLVTNQKAPSLGEMRRQFQHAIRHQEGNLTHRLED